MICPRVFSLSGLEFGHTKVGQMNRAMLTEVQIIGVLREHEVGGLAKEVAVNDQMPLIS